MDSMSLSVVLGSVLLSALAQLAFKVGMSAAPVQLALNGDGLLLKLTTIASNGHVLLGLTLYATSAAAWLVALSRLDVSLAYPFVALGIAITVLSGGVFLGEPLTTGRLMGVLLIIAGIVLLAFS